jgi:hypothetical protein
MRANERNSEVVPDEDPHLRAWNERERAKQERREGAISWQEWPEYFETTLMRIPVVDWRADDPHLLAGRERSTLIDRETVEHLRLDAAPRIEQWRQDRDRARREVRMLKKLGEEVPADVRDLAEQEDLGPTFDRWSLEQSESRARRFALAR